MPEITGFTMPASVEVEKETATANYAKFISEPWEKGFGHTLGNALRRILISSLEGVAVSSLRIEGVPHEFTTIPDVIEDVTDIILNIKKLKMRCDGELPRTLELYADKKGAVTAASVGEDGVTTVLNPDLHICTLDRDRPLRMEIEIDKGRGYRPAEMNKREGQPIGVIPIDCLFSPVERVRYDIQACRVGQRMDYDSLELEIWTDGRMIPKEALRTANEILQLHLGVFTETPDVEETSEEPLTEEQEELLGKMCMKVDDLELSVRAKNCLRNAGAYLVGELVQKTDSEMLKFRNFGKKSLDEIKEKLVEIGVHLGMDLPGNVLAQFKEYELEAAEERKRKEKEASAKKEESEVKKKDATDQEAQQESEKETEKE